MEHLAELLCHGGLSSARIACEYQMMAIGSTHASHLRPTVVEHRFHGDVPDGSLHALQSHHSVYILQAVSNIAAATSHGCPVDVASLYSGERMVDVTIGREAGCYHPLAEALHE